MKYSTYLIHIRAAMKQEVKGMEYPQVYTCNTIMNSPYSAKFPQYMQRALDWVRKQLSEVSLGTTYCSLFYTARLNINYGYPMFQFRIYMINRMIGEAKLEERTGE